MYMYYLSLEPKLQNTRIFFFWLKRGKSRDTEALLIFLHIWVLSLTPHFEWDGMFQLCRVSRQGPRCGDPLSSSSTTERGAQSRARPDPGTALETTEPQQRARKPVFLQPSRGWEGLVLWPRSGRTRGPAVKGLSSPPVRWPCCSPAGDTHLNPISSRDTGDDALGKSCWKIFFFPL